MQFNYPSLTDIQAPEGKKEAAEQQPEKPTVERPTAMDIFAKIVSWVLVPILMPVYGILLIFHLSILRYAPTLSQAIVVSVVFGINAILPSLLISLMKRLGWIHDVALNEQKERAIPYIITIVAFGCTALYLWLRGAPLWVSLFYCGGALAALINMLVNFAWKISAHAAGAAGVVAMLVTLARIGQPQQNMFWWIAGAIILTGLLGSSRLYLKRHTIYQVFAGYMVGFFSVYLLSLLA
jgi:membrane-associated phospholipid phosphatase